MGVMLCGKDLDDVIEGTMKEGFDDDMNKLPEDVARKDNCLVCSIITSCVREENYPVIPRVAFNDRHIYLALWLAHQSASAGSQYMCLKWMMSEQATDTKDVGRLLGRMDSLRQRLRNICPDGAVTIADVYISSIISALPELWSVVTNPLELQHTVTVAQLTNMLRSHLFNLKNRETHTHLSSSVTANSANFSKSNNSSGAKHRGKTPRLKTQSSSSSTCNHCGFKGHTINTCRTKQFKDLRKYLDDVKASVKKPS